MNAPTWPAVGLYPGIAPEVYFADQTGPPAEQIVSKSMLWKFAKNPRRYRDSPPLVPTAAMRWGSLVDCMALTPDRFASSYAITPETYPSAKEGPKPWNWNATHCKEWRAGLASGVEIVTPADMAESHLAVSALFARKEFMEMMMGAQTQVGMRLDLGASVHGHQDLVIRSKSLMDIVPARDGKWGNALADMKMFAKLNSMEDVEKEIYNRGYHGQAALYLDKFNALTGENRSEFFFVFQLSEAPYEVAIVELSEDAILAGRKWYREATHKWGKVVLTGEWESPWDGIQVANLPRWATKRENAA